MPWLSHGKSLDLLGFRQSVDVYPIIQGRLFFKRLASIVNVLAVKHEAYLLGWFAVQFKGNDIKESRHVAHSLAKLLKLHHNFSGFSSTYISLIL